MSKTFAPTRMAERIELFPILSLKPYERNARTHSTEQVDQIVQSIREFGFINPILIDENDGIMAGHGRLAAARQLNMELVPVVRLTGLTEYQKRAYIISDNKLALNSSWNDDLLAQELKSLVAADFDIDVVGFSDDELEDLLFEDEESEGTGDSSSDEEIERCPTCEQVIK